MKRGARQLLRLHTGRGLIALFTGTMFLPGILLAVFGVRAFYQERHLADQQIRDRLERAADLAFRELELELSRWQQAVDQTGETPVLDRLPLSPGAGRDLADTPGAGVLVVRQADELRALPPGQLLYQSVSAPAPPFGGRQHPRLLEAETYEIRDKDYRRAAALYRQLLVTAQPDDQALLMLRLARTNRKAGLTDAALELFQKLEGSTSRIGELPADLLANYEICLIRAERQAPAALASNALELYRGLVAGRWRLEKSRYFFYSEAARNWLEATPHGAPEYERMRATEQHKLALTRAVEQVVQAPRRAVPTEEGWHLVFWKSNPLTAVVLSEHFLNAHFWPRVLTAASTEDLEVKLIAPAHRPAHVSSSASRSLAAVARNLGEMDLPWTLEASPRHPELLHADLARRQNLYLTMLLLVMALLAFGGYLTVRTVRKEMEIVRLKSEFVSTVSHEFRSPVTGIRQLAEILMRGQPSEERRRQYYEMIGYESDRLARLVENILDFSRMEEGHKEYRLEALEAGEWLRALADEYRAECAQHGFSLTATVPDRLPVLMADREALSCALRNLLDNAVKYSPACKTVWLEAEATVTGLTIRVRDRGLGIAEEDQEHIFEKFYRGSGSGAGHVKGAGLGLSLVKHIVNAHGGSVECQSCPGKGSTFSIHLPALAGTPKDDGK